MNDMLTKIHFSELSYYPSMITNECINLGILFNYDNIVEFKFTSNLKRLKNFDDELDIDFIKSYLMGINSEVSLSLENYNREFNFENYISFYRNSFRFGKIKFIETENIKKDIEDIKKLYLRYDYPKNKRPKQDDVLDFMKKLISSKLLPDEVLEKPKINGTFEDVISYDFVVGSNAIKYFDFSNKDIAKIKHNLKGWAFNSLETSEKGYRCIFIYNDGETEKQKIDSAIGILSKLDADVYSLNDFLEGKFTFA